MKLSEHYVAWDSTLYDREAATSDSNTLMVGSHPSLITVRESCVVSSSLKI